ncbi:MAG: HEAT repeat domain-containing protein, partial [Pirellulaceae bacterium]
MLDILDDSEGRFIYAHYPIPHIPYLRIDPETGAMEALSGQTQFGRNRDDWGNWFGGNNSNPMWHYIIEDYVLRRNPHVPAPPVRKQVSEQPGAAQVFPTSRTLTRFNDLDRANRFTSACSPIVYRDQYLEQLVGQAFICEPVHNLIHREIMRPDGPSFSSRRLGSESNSEFLVSSDSWFRPTMIRTGPDGALWIADMYRLVIEHPKWIPKSWQQRLDLRSGADRGRIYRITRGDDQRPPSAAHQLKGQTTAHWIEKLKSSNGWQRDTAQQQLIAQNDPATVKPLQALAQSGQNPLGRLHALCTLDGMARLDAATVTVALRDAHPGVRRHAVRLASQFPTASLEKTLLQLVSDEKDAAVQLQIAITLGHFESEATGEALGQFANRHVLDNYRYAAALSSIHAKNLAHVMQGALSDTKQANGKLLEHLLVISAGLGNREVVSSLVTRWTSQPPFQPWQIRAVGSTLKNLRQRQKGSAQLLSPQARAGVERMIQSVQTSVVDSSLPADQRQDMVHLLAYAKQDHDKIGAILQNLLSARQPLELQAAAISTVLQFHDDGAKRLLQRWPSTTPALRVQMINSMLLETRHVEQLLNSLEQGLILSTDLDARQRQRLVANPDKKIANR